jgi:ribonucleotide reductase beta subunit family protein with ferritin-like domain
MCLEFSENLRHCGAVTTQLTDITYPDLYARWEHGQWAATDIDFSVDREDWAERMTEAQRRAALWNYSLFLHGEHAVAASLGPFIDAAPHAEQKYFLATQQADEARHAVMFARFMQEVAGAGASATSVLDSTRPQLTWGFRKIFGRLDELTARLRRQPTRPNLAAAVTMYHLIIEATLAQPGQRVFERYLEQNQLLPGLLEGMERVSADEQRHIGFGVKLLSELVATDPACRDSVVELIREVIPWVTAVFVPPGWDEREYIEVFGYRMEDIYEEGMRSFEQKLRAAGLAPHTLHGAAPWPMDLTPRERAERAVLLLRGNTIGEKLGPPARDEATVRAHFETLALAVDDRHAPTGPFTLEWRLDGVGPWHLRIEHGRGSAHPGPAPRADVVLRGRWEEWIDVAAGRRDPLVAMVTRRVRPSGDLRALRWLPRLFG